MNKPVKFRIIVVCLNAGDKLSATIESVLKQSYGEYEILVKDGGSTDGSVERLLEHLNTDKHEAKQVARESINKESYAKESFTDEYHTDGETVDSSDAPVRIISEPDQSIYDAMNQAIEYYNHQEKDEKYDYFYLFLNCGDYLQDKDVLGDVAKSIEADENRMGMRVVYGDRFNELTRSVEYSPTKIDSFTCFKNIPCHQTVFYCEQCFAERGYDARYRVRADYEHFLWCYFVKKALFQKIDRVVARYEGGGFSETRENERLSAKEHKEITKMYMSPLELFLFRGYLYVTLQPLRHLIAMNPKLAGGYNRLVKWIRG